MSDEVTLEDIALDYEFKGWTTCVSAIHRFIEKHEDAISLNTELLEAVNAFYKWHEGLEDPEWYGSLLKQKADKAIAKARARGENG